MSVYANTDNYGKFYYKDKKKTILHREDGPAIEYSNGAKIWYQNHKLHRMDGPAAEYVSGNKGWFVNDVFIFSVDSRGNLADRMK